MGCGVAEQHRVVGEPLRLHLVQALHHVDEIGVARRRGLGIAGQRRDHAFLVVADLPGALRRFLLRGVVEMREVAAHQPARLLAVLDAGLVVEVGHLLEAAVAHGGGERRDDQAVAEPGGELDRGLRERADIGRHRLLDRLRRDAHVVELIVLAVVRDAAFGGPEFLDHLHALFEDALVVLERDVERRVFAGVIAAAGGEIDAAAARADRASPIARRRGSDGAAASR